MKIVSLLGSPRTNGNSAAIANHFTETASKLGAEIKTYELNKLAYRGCQGCYACKKKLDHCALKDDLTEVLEAIHDGDVLLLASPIYFGEISSQMKAFMDRTFSFLKPNFMALAEPSRLKPKKLVFVISQGNPDESRFADVFPRYEFFMKWMGFSETKLIRVCGIGPATVDGVPEKVLLQAEEVATSLVA
jgi:multimeric flavodoxin WrbA